MSHPKKDSGSIPHQATYEVCVNSLESALAAAHGGAHRLELCENLAEGGTTPSYGNMVEVIRRAKLPVMVLIRPRAGSFCYSRAERKVMLRDIGMAAKAGAAGVVLGCLNEAGEIDRKMMKRLLREAHPLPVTFHRAFDTLKEPLKGLESIAELGCKRILSSGGKPTAAAGIRLLKQMVALAAGSLIIMPGGGISPENILQIREETGCREFHFSASHKIKGPRHSLYADRTVTDEKIVKAIIRASEKYR